MVARSSGLSAGVVESCEDNRRSFDSDATGVASPLRMTELWETASRSSGLSAGVVESCEDNRRSFDSDATGVASPLRMTEL